jgi:curved DNA-binding protein CbpA
MSAERFLMNSPSTKRDAKDERRSTRVNHAVFFTVTGTDGNGQPFSEQTGTLDVSLHGCKYFSRYAPLKNSWLTLEINDQPRDSSSRRLRARVAWVRKSRNLQGLFQVGVELESTGYFWELSSPPEDWQQCGRQRDSDAAAFERQMKELLALAQAGTYYQLLSVTSESSSSQIKRSYLELARKFHPDHHMDRTEWLQPLHALMGAITLAYKTLSDDTERQKYDQRLGMSGAFALRSRDSESQKTAKECMEKAKECFRAGNYGGSILWLRKAVDIEPQSMKCHALLGRALSAVPPYRREAIEHFQKAIELDPSNTTVQLQLAELYVEMKLPWRARRYYETILALDPENSKAGERLRQLDAAASNKSSHNPPLLQRLFRRRHK